LYADKLKSYTGSAPHFAQTLVEDFYKSNAAMAHFIQTTGLGFEAAPIFTRETLEKRSVLLHEMTKKIWNV
jgi:hypothetical protein